MTGIAAIFDLRPGLRSDLEGKLDAMMSGLAPRLADQVDVFHGEHAAIGARVLHTTEESRDAAQPYRDQKTGLVVVMDGYLSNYDEVQRDLRDHFGELCNRSEVELLARSYDLWGDRLVDHIDGEFAFIIYDEQRKRFLCARDHHGLRPLFYHHTGSRLVVGSDLAAVVGALERRPEPNKDFLVQLIADRWFRFGETAWNSVYSIRQAHSLSFSEQGLQQREYWTVPAEVTIRYKRIEDYAEHYLEVLSESLRRSSRVTGPLAMDVSGGLDSSALYCLAHKLQASGRFPQNPITGYVTSAREGSVSYERPYQIAAVKHVNGAFTEAPPFFPDHDWHLARSKEDYSPPLPPNAVNNFHQEQQIANDGARVLISGNGGDQWLGGLGYDLVEPIREIDTQALAKRLSDMMKADGLRNTIKAFARQFGYSVLPSYGIRAIRAIKSRRRWGDPSQLDRITPEARSSLAESERAFLRSLSSSLIAASKQSYVQSPYFDFVTSAINRHRARIGIETRYPMLSRSFIEFSARTPEWIKSCGQQDKLVHRVAMRGILPEQILARNTKANFPSEGRLQEFGQFCMTEGKAALEGLVVHEKIANLINANEDIDDPYFWEVYGAYASAAFLANFKTYGLTA